MRIHSEWTDLDIAKIKVTGGASKGDEICQVIANIFQAPVERFKVANSAGLGAAMRAAHAASGVCLEELVETFTASPENRSFEPDSSLAETYRELMNKFSAELTALL